MPARETIVSDMPPTKEPRGRERRVGVIVIVIVLAIIAVIYLGMNLNHARTSDERPMEARPDPVTQR